jgi:hypothetical protein
MWKTLGLGCYLTKCMHLAILWSVYIRTMASEICEMKVNNKILFLFHSSYNRTMASEICKNIWNMYSSYHTFHTPEISCIWCKTIASQRLSLHGSACMNIASELLRNLPWYRVYVSPTNRNWVEKRKGRKIRLHIHIYVNHLNWSSN